jgi:ankyrin repeat protein
LPEQSFDARPDSRGCDDVLQQKPPDVFAARPNSAHCTTSNYCKPYARIYQTLRDELETLFDPSPTMGAGTHRLGEFGASGQRETEAPSPISGFDLVRRHGAAVNAVDKGGTTALHYAANRGMLEVTRLLIEHGVASPDE